MKNIIVTIMILLSALLFCREGNQRTMETQKATFAGGCFWCMVFPFERMEGVEKVVSGYTGGHTLNPSYEDVTTGATGHLEAVEITFDPAKISYETLLDIFWKQINPTDAGGQFVDRGPQYKTAILYHSPAQKEAAEKSLRALENSGRFNKSIVTEIKEAGPFYPAEDYHQDFHKKNPVRYRIYRQNTGRDLFLKEIWK
ncbi:MAG TPA: peptide-methionine (S)-S-oxide reductase MsrA [Spirochaetota bacterium]|nr:peptide-methionine (S)-S-oxide reductase MsrA [Spirochaetota bacterium]